MADPHRGSATGNPAPDTVEATGKSLEILDLLKAEGPLSLSEVATHLGYSKSTVHRHLATLSEAGYVAEGEEGYRIGLLFLDYGIHARDESDLFQIARAKVDELAEELGEKVWLMAEENGYGIFLYHSTGKHPFTTYTRDGYRAPLHAFSAGKAILAFMDRDRIEDIIDRRGLGAQTEETITDREALFEELERIRERGVAFNRHESIRGIHAVGVPIFDEDDDPIGSLCVAGPANRLRGEYLESELPDLLLGVANEIEVSLTYS